MKRSLLPALFLAWPLAELFSLLEAAARVGALRTLALMVVAAVCGVAVIRHHGARGLLHLRSALGQGQSPAGPMVETLLAQLAGVLLVPGFVGDAVAMALLIPPLRRRLAARLAGPSGVSGDDGTRVIEGEFRHRDDA